MLLVVVAPLTGAVFKGLKEVANGPKAGKDLDCVQHDASFDRPMRGPARLLGQQAFVLQLGAKPSGVAAFLVVALEGRQDVLPHL